MNDDHWCPLDSLLVGSEATAIETLRESLGFDALDSYIFWEHLVARLLRGTRTSHRCAWNVETRCGDATLRISVSHAKASSSQFSNGPRLVFKFADPLGRGPICKSDLILLFGIDQERDVHLWAFSPAGMKYRASATMNHPKDLTLPSRSDLEKHRVSALRLDQVLHKVAAGIAS